VQLELLVLPAQLVQQEQMALMGPLAQLVLQVQLEQLAQRVQPGLKVYLV
jgi:hypothetical protein